jgi:hypothetical protein
MDNNNVKKRKTMSFEEFLKNKVKIEKGDQVVDDHYSNTLDEPKKIKIVKESKGWKEVAGPNVGSFYKTQEELNQYKTKMIGEGYEMDLDVGDIAEEHAKAIIAEAFEMSKASDRDGGINGTILQEAFDKICTDNGIDDMEDDRREMIVDAIQSILKELSGQATRLK